MATVNQLIKKPRKSKKAKSDVPALNGSPQKGVSARGFIQPLLKSPIQL